MGLSLAAALVAATLLVDRWRRRVLRRSLVDTCEILGARGIRYWADFGTLLGLVREGDLILGDKDVDLCLLAEELRAVVALGPMFAARGYQLVLEPRASGDLLRVLDRRSPWHVDVFPYRPDGETLVSPVNSPGEDVPFRLVAATTKLEWRGTTIVIPADSRALLVYRYGSQYLRPRRHDKGRGAPFSRLQAAWEDVDSLLVVLGWLVGGMRQPFRSRSTRRSSCDDSGRA